MRHAIFFITITTLLLISIKTTAQQLVQNGSFANSVADWMADCIDVEAYYPETTYGGTSSANLVAEVDDGSCFHQDVCVLPGADYILSLKASRRPIAAGSVTTNITVQGLDAANAATGAPLANINFTRTNTTFSFTPVTGIPVISVPAGSGIVRLRIKFTDATPGYSTLGMIIDDVSLSFQALPAYSGDTQTCINTATQLGIANLPSSGIFYNWQISGGTPAASTLATPVATWAATGTYPIYCILSNGVCPVDSVHRDITVATVNVPVVVSPVNYCLGQTAAPLSATGSTLKWYTTATGGVASLTAPVPSTATAGTTTWYVSNAAGVCESSRVPVTVNVNRVYARFVPGKYNICIGDPVTLNNLDSGNTALSYFWDFGDNTPSGNLPAPAHTYAGPGTYTITHIVSDQQPCYDTTGIQVTVLPKPAVNATVG